MPVVEAVTTVPIPPELAFAVSQTVAPVRYRWDPFVREQHFVDGATAPGGQGAGSHPEDATGD